MVASFHHTCGHLENSVFSGNIVLFGGCNESLAAKRFFRKPTSNKNVGNDTQDNCLLILHWNHGFYGDREYSFVCGGFLYSVFVLSGF
jgi:hypothetical protein